MAVTTTGKVRSNKIGIYISNTAIPDTGNTAAADGTFGDDTAEDDTFELIACATSGTFSGSLEIIDATTKDNDGQREILAGGLSWTMSCEGLIQFDLGATVRSNLDLFDLWQDKTLVRIAWTTGQNDDYMYYGNAYCTSIEESAGLNEVATFSVNFEGDGAVTKAVIDTTNVTFNDNNS